MKQLMLIAICGALELLAACAGSPGAVPEEPPDGTQQLAQEEPLSAPRSLTVAQPDPCRSSIDCPPRARCRTVDYVSSQQCGACSDLYPDECQTDADCPARSRCSQTGPCGCGQRQYKCTPGGCKTDAECKAGWGCDADGHCVPIPCKTDDACPAHFSCGAAGCARRACTSDAGCPGGYCVNRKCYAKLGSCYMPPPPPPSAAPSSGGVPRP